MRKKRALKAETARPISLITGGAGFVGSNLAHRLLSGGHEVVLLDNLARPSVEKNVEWLQATHGEHARLLVGDVRDAKLVEEQVSRAAQVFHFAAQVAVTTSLNEPLADFEVNARGTLNVLEALRRKKTRTPLLFTSTNKVYGALPDLALVRGERRYAPAPTTERHRGIDERRALDFHSPYGCSKGSADQYVLDYARTFGLAAAVFRMSCIYGERQFGNEDQGWVAHFMLRALRDEPITIYGDGRQVRDILYVGDLVEAMVAVIGAIDRLRGQAFNVGGGPTNTVSLLEVIDVIGELCGRPPRTTYDAFRPGDQRYYVSDTRKLGAAVAWSPRVGVREGLRRLHAWMKEQRLRADERAFQRRDQSRQARVS